MKIDIYEILSTNSLSGSRIIINDNFKLLADGINRLYNNINIDEDDNMIISDIKEISTDTANIKNLNADNYSKNNQVCMKLDDNNHLIILDENGELTLDVNQFIFDMMNSNNGEDLFADDYIEDFDLNDIEGNEENTNE